MLNNLTEEALELEVINRFEQLGYETANCMQESFGENSTYGRETPSAVVLTNKLREALHKLNPNLCNDAIQLAIEEITRDRSSLSLINANKEVYQLLKNGVNVTFKNDAGIDEEEVVQIINWNEAENGIKNDYFFSPTI